MKVKPIYYSSVRYLYIYYIDGEMIARKGTCDMMIIMRCTKVRSNDVGLVVGTRNDVPTREYEEARRRK